MPVFDLIQAIASAATTVGVLFAGWQLRQSRVQAVTTFEDQLAGQYRDIAHRLPIEALLGEPLDDAAHTAALGAMYHYFDLSTRFAVTENVSLTFSVENLTDKKPPLVGSTIGVTAFNSGNTYPSTYDALGRKFAASARVRF